jgi:hypothetical protein
VYRNGQGAVTPGAAYLGSGYSEATYVKADTTFTLTVTNAAGATATATATATVHATTPPVGFQPTGSMAVGRSQHRATLLADGRVLIVGGSGAYFTVTPEVYDPATGAFQEVGPSLPTMTGQSATRLEDGKVLLAGGGSGTLLDAGELPLATTLLFDPASGTFSGGPVMGTARYRHTSTLLPNGQVLIAGGQGVLNSALIPLASAELYDPATRAFKATGSLVNARLGATATLLPSGIVLIVGDDRYTGTSSAELYDPATGTFTSAGSMTAMRYYGTATLLTDGRVLVAGNGSADFFDPATGLFTATGLFKDLVGPHTATLLPDGTVLMVGGGLDGGPYLGNSTYAWLFDPATDTVRETGSLSLPRLLHSATLLPNGKVLVAGGQTYGVTSAEVYGL